PEESRAPATRPLSIRVGSVAIGCLTTCARVAAVNAAKQALRSAAPRAAPEERSFCRTVTTCLFATQRRIDEREDPVERREAGRTGGCGIRPDEAVIDTRYQKQLSVNACGPQPLVHLLRLFDRHGLVLDTVNEKHRQVAGVDVSKRAGRRGCSRRTRGHGATPIARVGRIGPNGVHPPSRPTLLRGALVGIEDAV